MKVYISGKISGLPDLGIAKFRTTELVLHNKGFEVHNPHRLPVDHDKSWESYMRVCLRTLTKMDSVAALDDWQNSRGAIIEVLIARFLKIPVYHAHDMMHNRLSELRLTDARVIMLLSKALLNWF